MLLFFIHPSHILGCSRGRKYVASALTALETSTSRPQRSRILGWSRGRKCVQSDMRTLETSLSRLHPSCILGWSRRKKWVPGVYRRFDTSLSRPHKVEFWACQEAENDFNGYPTNALSLLESPTYERTKKFKCPVKSCGSLLVITALVVSTLYNGFWSDSRSSPVPNNVLMFVMNSIF